MITALSNIAAEFYTPLSEIDEDTPTRFKLKPLNGIDYMNVITESGTNAEGNFTLSAASSQRALKSGLVDWENFNFSDGKTVKFSIHNFKSIPATTIAELLGQIMLISSVDEGDSKN